MSRTSTPDQSVPDVVLDHTEDGAGRVLSAGKLPADVLSRLLADLGPAPADVLIGPAVGEDACAVEVPAGVIVGSTDPITLTSADVGRYAVMVNANDVAVGGARPRWFLATVLMPVGSTQGQVEEVFGTIREALAEVGAALVGGHTEVTAAVNQPVVVGQMLGLAPPGAAVATSGAAVGDVVVQAGLAPVEGAAVLAAEAVDRLATLPVDIREAARAAVRAPGISVVDAALLSRDLGATALHDPTEGGLASGLHELAAAAGARIRVDRDQVLWFPPGLEVCRLLGADPWATLASGALLATFPPERTDVALRRLSRAGVPAAAIGVVEAGDGVYGTDADALPWPERDETVRLQDPGVPGAGDG
ncbi:AIR synthase-related protein [Phytoactinopolyspora limicola]|uniref:AIR synthase-related protein n=1 Tax=Phytoactinopolyspora limicola TaxID=2715536 RepID=UPI001409314A|nr:AIR synthase-related protein [Phytoactinopolyspora limicola]